MPSPVKYSASNLKSIHLLRALLREASYLPDAGACQYFRRYIISRFKAYQPAKNAATTGGFERYRHKGFKRRHISIIEERTSENQKKARKALNYLRRANNGHLPCLEKIMLLTYGRMGERRYALLNDLFKPEPPANEELVETQEEPAPLQRLYYSNKHFLAFFGTPRKVSDNEIKIDISDQYPRLRAVLTSQTARHIALHRDISSSTVVAPTKNVWERTMPIKRARNIVRRWYKLVMGKLLPPLPDEEWDRLRGLSTGDIRWEGVVQGRTPATVPYFRPESTNDSQENTLRKGLIPVTPSYGDKPRGKKRPHVITPRLMKRLYAKLLALSCKVEWNSERNKWTVQWGPQHEMNPRIYFAPVDESLFEGVDDRGRLVRPAKTKSQAYVPRWPYYNPNFKAIYGEEIPA
ncbi:hypothetical protein K469DRAFT_725051 [Zopfia rhizophila CBS 207.26]|uniref:LYR motif-containing protein Cup1-like N-terminal domain-containing protein n=1 Tax=Zopfia rhizophila CBS 207.26 TaxID=1314779 RepID=A0A6A6EA59_9PEZI|nr:hypothetical protein K469DRAFT_725051 [Zopfia rhizophila CBS 207.26]